MAFFSVHLNTRAMLSSSAWADILLHFSSRSCFLLLLVCKSVFLMSLARDKQIYNPAWLRRFATILLNRALHLLSSPASSNCLDGH